MRVVRVFSVHGIVLVLPEWHLVSFAGMALGEDTQGPPGATSPEGHVSLDFRWRCRIRIDSGCGIQLGVLPVSSRFRLKSYSVPRPYVIPNDVWQQLT